MSPIPSPQHEPAASVSPLPPLGHFHQPAARQTLFDNLVAPSVPGSLSTAHELCSGGAAGLVFRVPPSANCDTRTGGSPLWTVADFPLRDTQPQAISFLANLLLDALLANQRPETRHTPGTTCLPLVSAA